MRELVLQPELAECPATLQGFGELEGKSGHHWRWALGKSQSISVRAEEGSFIFYRFTHAAPGAKISIRVNGREAIPSRFGEFPEARIEGCLRLSHAAAEGAPFVIEVEVSETRNPGDGEERRQLAYIVERFALIAAGEAYDTMECVLENAETGQAQSLKFRILGTPIAQRWAHLLTQSLERGTRLVKHFCFLGWPAAGRPLSFLCEEMNRHIATINAFFGAHPELPYRIGMEFRPEILESQDLFNRIHHHFELLIGQVWDVSPYFLAADKKAKHAICQLNHFCHEIEALLSFEKSLLPGSPFTRVELVVMHWPPYGREDLYDEDYKEFTPRPEWGDVIAHYAQPGKAYYQAFEHDDEIVGDKNVNGLRYISGEFNVHISTPHRDPAAAQAHWEEFRSWLRRRGLDPNDPKLSLGKIVLAKLDRESLGQQTITDQLTHLLHHFNNVKEIKVRRKDGRVVSRAYPYYWRDPDYERDEVAAL